MKLENITVLSIHVSLTLFTHHHTSVAFFLTNINNSQQVDCFYLSAVLGTISYT